MTTLRILIADDHPLYRDGLRAALARAGFDVVGEAADGGRAVALSLELHPDVVIMDLHMPRIGGIEASRRIARGSPHTAILVLTMLADDESVFAALRAGARGYLLKGAGQAGDRALSRDGCLRRRRIWRIYCPSSHGTLQRPAPIQAFSRADRA